MQVQGLEDGAGDQVQGLKDGASEQVQGLEDGASEQVQGLEDGALLLGGALGQQQQRAICKRLLLAELVAQVLVKQVQGLEDGAG